MIQVIKLTSGEEIIAEAEHVNFQFVVWNAMALVMQQGPKGLGQSLVPWGHSVDGTIKFDDRHVIYVGNPIQELLDVYNKAFNDSGLAIPDKNLILG